MTLGLTPRIDKACLNYFNKTYTPTQVLVGGVVAWTKTAVFAVSTQADIHFDVNGTMYTVASGTAVTMVDSATIGRNYYIYARTDGSLGAYLDTTTAPSGGRIVGGFHYAPGSNAAEQSGGNKTAQINEYSFWDLKWRPSCVDPRGMTLVANSFWCDIYLLGYQHRTNGGTSIYNVAIADGGRTVERPTLFGAGNYEASILNWYNSSEIVSAYGKKLPSTQQFPALAYGVAELVSLSSDPVNTGLVNGTTPGAGVNVNAEAYTSKWGVIQATGNLNQWGADWNTSATLTTGWIDLSTDLSAKRGQQYQDSALRCVFFGGDWNSTSFSGSRCASWHIAPSNSASTISVRGVCDHLKIV